MKTYDRGRFYTTEDIGERRSVTPEGFLVCHDVPIARTGIQIYSSLEVPIEDAGSGKNPLTWSGGLAWIQDYPDPDDFYSPILGCDSNVAGGWNWSRYCNQDLQAQNTKLLTISDRKARLDAYKPFFKTLMDEAVWVPVHNGEYTVAHAEKLHGGPTLTHPEHSLIYETMWLAQ